MTATPKRTESVDTYAYFCAEEPEAPLDPSDETKGAWRPPAYTYSLGEGIDDGFLATYKVHKVRTSIDEQGLTLEDAQAQGAEIFVPEDVTPRDLYSTAQFEREIRLPDRTAAIVKHLGELLRTFDPMQKTMVFCVDVEHARLVAHLLQNAFAHLGYADYAVPIVSEEPEAVAHLERFRDSDQPTPVVATTAELLTTGVDVPACRNIVFVKPISSPILFKQIVGRGSRVDPATNKEWFRIVDYVNACRLFDSWDRPPGDEPPELPEKRTSALAVQAVDADSGQLLVGASVTVLIAANLQSGPKRTGEDGFARFAELPAGMVRVSVSGSGYTSRTVTVDTSEDETANAVVELRLQDLPPEQVRVRGLEVTIADEAIFLIEESGERMTLEEYREYAAARVRGEHETLASLAATWKHPTLRTELLTELTGASVELEVLGDVLGLGGVDQFDLMAHIAFDQAVLRRAERAEAVRTMHVSWLSEFPPEQREVIEALLDQYARGGIAELATGEVLRLEPFRTWGQAPGVADRFGGAEQLAAVMKQLQQRIYEIS
jgi:type I restriction enzyme, R subunit